MATTVKALAIARELSDRWAKEVASTLPVITPSFDSSGNPVLTLSADADPTYGEKIVVVRVAPITWTATDILGNASQIYTPHVVEICTELNYAATNDNIADILTPVELLPVIAECVKTGCLVKWYQITNGTAPATTYMTSTYLKATYGDLYWNAQKAS